jgi:hypothetical protein
LYNRTEFNRSLLQFKHNISFIAAIKQVVQFPDTGLFNIPKVLVEKVTWNFTSATPIKKITQKEAGSNIL